MKFKNRKVLIGITGGIAAYKVCYLIRSIKKQGGEVKTILTWSGENFITKTTLEALSGEPVAASVFDPVPSKTIQHIDLAKWPDCFVVAPATANIVAKAANGIADDLLSTTIISHPGKIIFAPAMNDEMWKYPATQENIKRLHEFGHIVIPPGEGELACDTVGVGRMAEPEAIEEAVVKKLGIKSDLAGKRILITAGGTEEKIDTVRFIGNRSSGKMGRSLAEAALKRGADVSMILGTHMVSPPDGVNVTNAVSSEEMANAVKKESKKHDILIMAAAVADFRPADPIEGKIKKDGVDELSLSLTKTEDILKSVSRSKNGLITVGFALETENQIENARKKLKDKKLDIIVLNDPKDRGSAFNEDTNKVTVLENKSDRIAKFPLMSKDDVAEKIMDKIVELITG